MLQIVGVPVIYDDKGALIEGDWTKVSGQDDDLFRRFTRKENTGNFGANSFIHISYTIKNENEKETSFMLKHQIKFNFNYFDFYFGVVAFSTKIHSVKNIKALKKSDTSVELRWDSSASDPRNISGYDIYRDGSLLKSVEKPNFTDTGLVQTKTYNYKIMAFDSFGVRTLVKPASTISIQLSSMQQAPTSGSRDRTAPSAPTNLRHTTNADRTTITLTWNSSNDNNKVKDYRVYQAVGGVFDPVPVITISHGSGATHSVTIEELNENTRYSYVVRSFDESENRSLQSNIVHKEAKAQVSQTNIRQKQIPAPEPVSTFNSSSTTTQSTNTSAPAVVQTGIPPSATAPAPVSTAGTGDTGGTGGTGGTKTKDIKINTIITKEDFLTITFDSHVSPIRIGKVEDRDEIYFSITNYNQLKKATLNYVLLNKDFDISKTSNSIRSLTLQKRTVEGILSGTGTINIELLFNNNKQERLMIPVDQIKSMGVIKNIFNAVASNPKVATVNRKINFTISFDEAGSDSDNLYFKWNIPTNDDNKPSYDEFAYFGIITRAKGKNSWFEGWREIYGTNNFSSFSKTSKTFDIGINIAPPEPSLTSIVGVFVSPAIGPIVKSIKSNWVIEGSNFELVVARSGDTPNKNASTIQAQAYIKFNDAQTAKKYGGDGKSDKIYTPIYEAKIFIYGNAYSAKIQVTNGKVLKPKK